MGTIQVELKFEKLSKEELLEIIISASTELKSRLTVPCPTLVPVTKEATPKTGRRRGRKPKKETEKIDKFITANFKGMSPRELAEELKIDVKLVYNRIQSMGLRKGGWKANPLAQKRELTDKEVEHDRKEQGL